MASGGRRSTTWPKGTNPKKQKGTRDRKTVVKQSLGLTGWARLTEYLLNEGADKMVEELAKIKGKDFITASNALVEFVKPKLQRTTVEGDPNKPLMQQVTVLKIVMPEGMNLNLPNNTDGDDPRD